MWASASHGGADRRCQRPRSRSDARRFRPSQCRDVPRSRRSRTSHSAGVGPERREAMTDARGIVKALGGMWTGSYGLARCPAHDDHKPSLKIKDDPNKRDGIDLICFAGCDWRDVKAELQRQGLIETRTSSVPANSSALATSEARRKLASRKPKPSKPELSPEDRTRIALGIWQQSVRLKDTLGWKYFTERRQLHIGLL